MNYKFSIITPEHDKKNIPYLMELYQSILSQTYDNWEWILYLNGNCKENNIPDEIKSNDKVKIYSGKTNPSVGAIKNKAFSLGTGDILVEVDHDDMLTENCLEELNKAFQDPEVGFAYSEHIMYDMRGNEYKVPWNPEYGWTHKWMEFRGEQFIKIDMFPPTSHSLGIIWYAPDHVRSWRKNVYEELGGHDPQLEICDDHDLVIRTYLNTKICFIPKVLYYYRWLPERNNTQTKRLDRIQTKTFELFHKYGVQLAERDSQIRKLKNINLSGKYSPLNGYINLNQDELRNTCTIPYPDNSAFIINASHVLQHFDDPIKIMSEIYRVLCDGGWAFIDVPSTDGRGAFQDPSHRSFWNQNSFWYYTRADKARFIDNNTTKFQEFRLETNWWEDNIAVTTAWLCAIKSNERRPHPVRI